MPRAPAATISSPYKVQPMILIKSFQVLFQMKNQSLGSSTFQNTVLPLAQTCRAGAEPVIPSNIKIKWGTNGQINRLTS